MTNIHAGGTTQVSGALRALMVLALLLGLSGAAAKTLHTLDVLRDLPDEQVVKSKDEAREVAIRLLGSDR